LWISSIFFLDVPPPEPPRSSTANETITSRMSPPPHALVHLMSQFRMDKAAEPKSMSLATLEKMSLRDTQHLLTENGLEK
jgi:hypothetical protein